MIVIKIGGGEGVDFENVVNDFPGRDSLIVHGISSELNNLQKKLGIRPRFVRSVSGFISRFTDQKTLELLEMVCGKIRCEIVARLQDRGINAIGLCGVDGRILIARRKDVIKIFENGRRKILRGDHTGKIETVNTNLLRNLLESGFVPVISPIAISDDGVVNVDGDRAAAAIAVAMHADLLIILSNVPGLMDRGKLIRRISVEDAMQYARGRMKTKILAAKEAIRGGVKVVIGNANAENPVSMAMRGNGTVII